MSNLARALAPLTYLSVLPLAVASSPSMAAEARKPVAAAAAAPTDKATTDIIPLPLNPTLPAGQRLCASKSASGLGYTMLRPASGDKPTEADYVLVNYIGYLASNGTVFDQGTQAAFPVNGVIPGFSEGLQLLAKTGIARLCIPAAMAYGEQGSGPIPGNSDLVFQIELLDYKTAAEIEAMRNPGAEPQ